MVELPRGTVTFLATDVEGSTRLLEQLGERYAVLLAEHHGLMRRVIEQHVGAEVRTQGDAFLVAFARATDALLAATQMQHSMAAHAWPDGVALRVRIGLHTGEPILSAGSYVGLDVHRAGHLCAAGHGGQVLLSHTTRDLVQHALPPGVSLRDRGAHRLKDLHQPEHIFELVLDDLPGGFPVLRTLSARPNNLPAQATPIVGREREQATLRERLLRREVRLLTLTGPGGTGKTRLSLQLAADVLEEFAHGVFFVQLASISDPALVPSAIARAVGVQESAGRPVLDTLAEYLRDKQLLLILDNFEQVMAAATLVGELLARCGGLKILVTSRAVLRIYGEHDYAVPPLSLPAREPTPSIEHLLDYEAFRLFVERAQAVKSDFAVTARSGLAVAEICHRLDGLPLGIELAAARVRVLPPETMLVRMDRRLPLLTGGLVDRPPRHQTLRSAIEWSHDLLDDAEKSIFRRLPVFAGGFTLEAAEAICGGWGSPADVLAGVESLIDKSLLREEETADGSARLQMLETIREYGLEHLEASGEASELRRRHAVYYLALAEEAEPILHGPDQVAWLDQLEAEYSNLRAALAWCWSEPGGVESGLRLSGSLLWFWLVRGYFAEGGRALATGLALGGPVSDAVQAKALNAAGHLAQYERDFARSEALLEASMRMSRKLGDERGAARSLSLLGETARVQGNYEQAMAIMEESLALQQQLGDRWGTYHSLFRLGEAARNQGQNTRAATLHEQSLQLRREMGDTRGIAASLHSLGLLALAREDFGGAATILKQGLATHRLTRNRFGTAMCLEGLAAVALARDEPQRAAQLLGALEALLGLIGVPLLSAERARYEANRELARSRLDEPTFLLAHSAGQTMGTDAAIVYALDERGTASGKESGAI